MFHWTRWRRGIPLDAPYGYRPPGRAYGRDPLTASQKVMPHAGQPGECWEWSGVTTADGYGVVDVYSGGNRRRLYVHRVAYEHAHGTIPDGLEIDHLCRVRACFNPEHLEAVTHAENLRRAREAAQ